tara:strand:+ start:782 stop:1192 length:411 start_codon:yes stop_codon:yes gene_type:complete
MSDFLRALNPNSNFKHIADIYDVNTLQELHDIHCSNNPNNRIFFEGPVKFIRQQWNGAIYKLVEDLPETIIKLPNSTHLRLADYPYPKTFDVLAPTIDIKLWREKRIIEIISGDIPKSYISLGQVDYYLEMRSRYG